MNKNKHLTQEERLIIERRLLERESFKSIGRELRIKEKALAETAALLLFQKKPKRFGGTPRKADQRPLADRPTSKNKLTKRVRGSRKDGEKP